MALIPSLIKPTIEKIYCAAKNYSLLQLQASEVEALNLYLRMMDIVLEELMKRWDDDTRQSGIGQYHFSANGDPL